MHCFAHRAGSLCLSGLLTFTFCATISADYCNEPLGISAALTSSEGAGAEATLAIDGDSGTIWVSAANEDEWIYVDLGAMQQIEKISLRWGTIFGADYDIEISDDAVSWTTVRGFVNQNGGEDDHYFSAAARYVRMLGRRVILKDRDRHLRFDGLAAHRILAPVPAVVRAGRRCR